MNDEIHAARYVTKTHTTNVATFRTPTLGPIGLVTKTRILFMQELLDTQYLDISTADGLIPIVKAYAGMHGDLLEAFAHTKVDGLIIEALGAGNLPPQTIGRIEKTIESKSTDCFGLSLFQWIGRTCLRLCWRRKRIS
jgi:L-asparaginase